MSIRPRYLPSGWYPDSKRNTERKIEGYLSQLEGLKTKELCISGVVPHAGWDFSGKIALNVIRHLNPENDTVVIIGGHLSPASNIYAAFEDEYETPLGNIKADLQLLERMNTDISMYEDTKPDNTVEVQLSFVKYLFPESMVLGLRAPPSDKSIKLGKVLKDISLELNKKIVVIGSTDLTHYGPSYMFSPKGGGLAAVNWVKDVNDKRFIDSLIDMNSERALKLANTESSACSAGGAAAALSFAAAAGAKQAKLLDYTTSWDIMPGDSFVGYAGLLFT